MEDFCRMARDQAGVSELEGYMAPTSFRRIEGLEGIIASTDWTPAGHNYAFGTLKDALLDPQLVSRFVDFQLGLQTDSILLTAAEIEFLVGGRERERERDTPDVVDL